MEDLRTRRSGLRRFLELIAAALFGGLIVLASMPALLPYILPEQQQQIDRDYVFPWLEPQSAPDLEHQQTAVVSAVNRVAPAVVGVTKMVRSGTGFRQTSTLVPAGVGSGVIFSPEGYIITNYHVIEQAVAVMVTLGDGQELEAEIVGEDPGTDLAVLKIDPPGPLPVAELGDSDSLTPGEFAIAIGNPGGLELQQSVTLGIISATERSLEVYDWVFGLLQTDAAINPGNSGGPLINLAGQVIGINSVKLINAEGLGFSIPSNLVKNVVESLVEEGRVIRPMLGVSIREVTTSLAQANNLSVDYGLYVVETPIGGPAHEAGIRPDDIIIEIAGIKTESLRDLRRVLSTRRVGDEVVVQVKRDGQEINFTLVLADLAS